MHHHILLQKHSILLLLLAFSAPSLADGAGKTKNSEAFSFPPSTTRNRLVIVSCDGGSGHRSAPGFVAVMDGKSYLVASQRVLFGVERVSFKTVSGKTLRPGSVELSASRDIARLLLAGEPDRFGVSEDVPMGSAICIFGIPAAGKTERKLCGKVIGVGSETVEVSIRFSLNESGAPILNAAGEVAGLIGKIMEPSESVMTKGTKFGHKPRFFCYRMANTRWIPVDWKKYNANHGAFFRRNMAFAKNIGEIASRLNEDSRRRVRIGDTFDTEISIWARSHNRFAGGHAGSTRKKQVVAAGYSESVKKLSRICQGRIQKIDDFLARGDLTGFLREELESLNQELDYSAKLLNFIGDNAQDYR